MSQGEQHYWRAPEGPGEQQEEFPAGVGIELGEVGRRDFLIASGFSLAGSLLAGCTRLPADKAIPYLVQPEEFVPGQALLLRLDLRRLRARGCGAAGEDAATAGPSSWKATRSTRCRAAASAPSARPRCSACMTPSASSGPSATASPPTWDEVDGEITRAGEIRASAAPCASSVWYPSPVPDRRAARSADFLTPFRRSAACDLRRAVAFGHPRRARAHPRRARSCRTTASIRPK